MKKHILTSAVALVAMAPVTAFAGPGYDYVEAGYISVDPSPGPTFDGFGLNGSFAINERFHVVASWSRVSESPITVTESTLGLGFNHGVSDTTDFVARLGGIHGRVKVTGIGSASDNGWFAQVGFRSMLTSAFELNGFVTQADVSGSETSLDFRGVYHFTNQFGATAGVSLSDDATGWGVGFRFSF